MIDFNFVYELLAKIGYMHPIHPTEVHMPIGLVVGSVVFAVVALIFRSLNLSLTARHCIILSFIWVFPTMLFGYMDWQHYYAGVWLFPIKVKIIVAFMLMALLFISLLLGSRYGARAKITLLFYFFCFLCVVVLGYFGGQLVYGSRYMTPSAPQEYKAGELVFDHNCSGCHPHGGNAITPSLPLVSAPQLNQEDKFTEFIRDPRKPDGSPGVMPKFSVSVLPDNKARELYQYIINVLKNPKRG